MQNLRKIFLSFLAFLFATNPAFAVFNDVEDDELAPEVIEFLREHKIGEATPNFYPRRPVELAEFLAMGLAAAGVERNDLLTSAATRFTDVPSGSWFAPYVYEAEQLGILDDFRGYKLLPRRALHKGEAVALGLEIFGVGIPPAALDEEFGFQDLRERHRLARPLFQALKMGLVEPVSDEHFGVTRRFTRAEAAQLFYNIAHASAGTTVIIRSGVPRIPGWPLFETVWKDVQNKFLFEENVDDNEMMYSALDGLIDSLDDPHSDFLTPQKAQAATTDLAGEIEGIGAYLSTNDDGTVVIVAPISGSPAEAAGLLAGDIITRVDGESIAGFSADEAAQLIRGEAGTQVVLTVRRNGVEKDFSVTRAKVQIKSVELKFRNEVAIVKIAQFTSPTAGEFATAIEDILASRARGIILDLRNNGGGLVNSAVAVLSHFLPQGAIVVTQRHRGDLASRDVAYRTETAPDLNDYKIAVLVNRGTASASEIVASALQDHGLATVVGEQTFGKGTVQEISFFGDGTALKLTIAHWLSPKQQPIQDEGVTPEFISIDDPETQLDEALERALDLF